MSGQINETIWLSASDYCHIEHLVDVSGLSIDEVEDLVASGVIQPIIEENRPRRFKLEHVLTVNTARRLRDDFQLDQNGIALALTLLQRINELEAELINMKAKFGR